MNFVNYNFNVGVNGIVVNDSFLNEIKVCFIGGNLCLCYKIG